MTTSTIIQHQQKGQDTFDQNQVDGEFYRLIKENFSELPERQWPPELVDHLAVLIEENEINNPWTQAELNEWLQAVDNYANRRDQGIHTRVVSPKNMKAHFSEGPNQEMASHLNHLSPDGRTELQSLLATYPSLFDTAVTYVTSDEEVRKQTQALVLDELARPEYTVAEVDEMLRMFWRLERLVNVEYLRKLDINRLNAQYHGDLRKVDQILREMDQYAKEEAKKQRRYNQSLARRRTQLLATKHSQQTNSQQGNLEKVAKAFRDNFEKVLILERGGNVVESEALRNRTTGRRGIKQMLSKYGLDDRNNNIVARILAIVKGEFSIAEQRIFSVFEGIRHLETGEPMFLCKRTPYRVERSLNRVLEREF